MRIAHLSDPHLPISGLPPLVSLASKRGVGYINWLRRRRFVHRRRIANALADDLRAQNADHVVLTGDLINISLRREFRDAAAWLEALGAPDRISLVPGNHDSYVPVSHRRGLGLWADYMRGDGEVAAEPGRPLAWPYVRRRGQLALIGVSTALPTALFMATGEVGEGQLARLEEILVRLREEGLCRIVMIHHSPLPQADMGYRRLTDAEAFQAMLGRAGAELVLHGHLHDHTLGVAAGPGDMLVPVIGVPSASSAGSLLEPPAQYNLLSIEQKNGAWEIHMEARRIDPDEMTFATHVSMDVRAEAAGLHANPPG